MTKGEAKAKRPKIMTCKKCGKKPKNPTIHTLGFQGEAGTTCLGRKIELIPKMGIWVCGNCGYKNLDSISLQIDPDAELVKRCFDLQEKDGEPSFRDICAFLRTKGIGVDDLEEFDQLKRDLLGKDLSPLIEWLEKRGITPEIIVEEAS